ncbi:MAG TPA: hypothetical protein GXZ53_00430 [Firmicutes bacterium]|nr:hypothetical protein [Bacillota bacterium]
MLKKYLKVILLVFLASTILVSCQRQEVSKPLVWGIPYDVETLNPLFTRMAVETDILNCIFSTLIKVNDKQEFVPDLLAEMPQISEDGLEYSFTLRQDVKFHDGQELTAEDVKYTYEMKMAENNAVPDRYIWERIDTFRVTDKYNFKIKLKSKDVTWLENLAYANAMIVPKHILEEEFNAGGNAVSKGGDFSRNPVGSGPYKFVEWKTNEYIKLEAYDDYYRGAPAIKEIIFKVAGDSNSLLAQFAGGEIDIYDRAEANQYGELLQLKEEKDIEVYKYPSYVYMHADFNLRNPIFQDQKVRQALNYAFPKDSFIENVLGGVGIAAHSYIPPWSWAYNPDVKKYDYNPDLASELLDEAGWLRGEDGVRVKDGVRLEFTINTNTGDSIREKFEVIAKQEWEKIGAKVNIQNYEPGTLVEDILQNVKFDIIVFAWKSGFDPNAENLWHSQQRPDLFGTGQNYIGFADQRVDELLEAGLQEQAREKRVPIYREIQQILSEEAPCIFVYFYNDLTAVPSGLKNFKPNPTQANNTWNIWEWELES